MLLTIGLEVELMMMRRYEVCESCKARAFSANNLVGVCNTSSRACFTRSKVVMLHYLKERALSDTVLVSIYRRNVFWSLKRW